MRENDFRMWLKANYSQRTEGAQIAKNRRIEKAYGDLDEHYDNDRFASILSTLQYSKSDVQEQKPHSSKLTFNTDNLYEGLADARSALTYYRKFREAKEGKTLSFKRENLEIVRKKFLELCPDFIDFQKHSGGYYEREREYKDQVIAKATKLLKSSENLSPMVLGKDFIKILSDKPANFVSWRVFNNISKSYAGTTDDVAKAIGEMLTEKSSVPEAFAKAVAIIHPIIQKSGRGYAGNGQVRSLVTAAMAVAKPTEAIFIKTRIMQRAWKEICGGTLFKSQTPNAEEYRTFINFAENIYLIMQDEWGWKPNDLWDVQGFLWVVFCEDWALNINSAGDEDENEEEEVIMNEPSKHPLNQILYGPPGTGKTWNTAKIAVEICNGFVPESRTKVMEEYNKLKEAGRIVFTTFHQSMSYEEFVEGLRPETGIEGEEYGSNASAGFSLKPKNGIFRELCVVANESRKQRGKAIQFDFKDKQFFKMSLGNAKTEQHVYDDAIEGNYITLGWGGEVDWSDPKYKEFRAIYDKWQEIEPGTSGNSGNISQIWCFRSSIKKGDIVIISDGNLRFRAIAEVTGDYEFVPNEAWHHRRKVKWLKVFDESLPADKILEKKLSQVSCYLLQPNSVKKEALAKLITPEGNDSSGNVENHVLIIDEINRANISKVFGELITLIENDKRLGNPNVIEVTLPYSGDNFGVPNNLYIIGTMNTADRSIALLDSALRRRFDFVEMMPDYNFLKQSVIDEINLSDLLYSINERVEWLLNREHQIGHSYLMEVKNKDELDAVMKQKIIPLLKEYFYEDWEKVRIVLNDKDSNFIKKAAIKAPSMQADEGEERYRYTKNDGSIPIEAYKNIYAK